MGGSLYYDARWTQDNSQFNQVGLGIEALTSWVDARANLYLPENTRNQIGQESETVVINEQRLTLRQEYAVRHELREVATPVSVQTLQTSEYSIYEVPLKGFDAEIGVKAPLPETWQAIEARLFLGYYDFEPKWKGNVPGSTEASGVKGRLEVRAWNRLFLDAELFENDELFGSDYLLGARFRMPLGERGIKTAAGPVRVADRMAEMVMRDPQIQVRQSASLVETVLTRQQTQGQPVNRLLADDIIFVFGDNTDDPRADGSAEHPLALIQEGVDEAAERNWSDVYVFGASNPYRENVVINNTLNLQGEGQPYNSGLPATRGYGRPIIEGMASESVKDALKLDMDPAFAPAAINAFDATSVRIAGFALTAEPNEEDWGEPLSLKEKSMSRIGFYGINIQKLVIEHNWFDNLEEGVSVGNDRFGWIRTGQTIEPKGTDELAQPVDYLIANNRMTDVEAGISTMLEGAGGQVRILDNEIINTRSGIMIQKSGHGDPIDLLIARNTVTGMEGYEGYGIGVLSFFGARTSAAIVDNTISSMTDSIVAMAVDFDAWLVDASALDVTISGNTIVGPTSSSLREDIKTRKDRYSTGIAVVAGEGAAVTADIHNNTISSANNGLEHAGGGYTLTQGGAQQDAFIITP